MFNLESEHPDVYEEFSKGHFSVQMSDHNTFGRNEADKTIENTINRDTKTPGGQTGFSRKYAAVCRWTLNSSRRASCRKKLARIDKAKIFFKNS